MLSALLFDLDGTLVDTNDLHVRAWDTALRERGFRVATDRLAVEMGKGGDHLVTDVLGRSAEESDGDALREGHDRAYAAIIAERGIERMPGAVELIEKLRARGDVKLALVTSSKPDSLELVERASKTSWRSMFDVVVGAEDDMASKPSPDLVTRAIGKLGMTPAECAMFGDTIWDAKAAVRAGVVLVGLTCGGNSERDLRGAGARFVLEDPRVVSERLDAVLDRASPGSARLDRRALDKLMAHALDAADRALEAGEAPIGCALARGDGELIATGYNRFVETGDKARHAEIDAFRAAGARIPRDARDTILISTLEPCVMCLGAAMVTAVDTVIYALRAPEDAGTGRVAPPQADEDQMPRIVGNVRANESRRRFERWLESDRRDRSQEPFIRAVLAGAR